VTIVYMKDFQQFPERIFQVWARRDLYSEINKTGVHGEAFCWAHARDRRL